MYEHFNKLTPGQVINSIQFLINNSTSDITLYLNSFTWFNNIEKGTTEVDQHSLGEPAAMRDEPEKPVSCLTFKEVR